MVLATYCSKSFSVVWNFRFIYKSIEKGSWRIIREGIALGSRIRFGLVGKVNV